MKLILFWCFLLLIIRPSFGQGFFAQPNYPQGYFRNPLDLPISLAGNFGDLRAGHFHMGLDFRTNGKENYPVYAAAEGYISRIKIETSGYGNAIYITHPNGFVTLYAHLNQFFPALQQYLVTKQYKDQKWEQDFNLTPNEFKVSAGQWIAFSGNTGGSEGPHLHFEIRDAKTENNLNTQLFGFDIPDTFPPTLYRIGLYDRKLSTYEQDAKLITLKKDKSGTYYVKDTILYVPQKLSFSIGTEDKVNGSFKFGIYQAELFVDDSLYSAFRIDNFIYPVSRYINACTDFKLKANGGPWMMHLSCLPGNEIGLFALTQNEGVIELNDDTTHRINIVIKDCSGNASTASFVVRRDTIQTAPLPAYPFVFQPHKKEMFANERIQIEIPANALYDSIWFRYSNTNINTQKNQISETHSIHRFDVPLHTFMTVRMKPFGIKDSLKNKVYMQVRSRRNVFTSKVIWMKEGWALAQLRNFGETSLMLDTIPPIIRPVNFKEKAKMGKLGKLVIASTDDETELASFNVYLDGQWLMFAHHKNYFTYNFDERCLPGFHELRIEAVDELGNKNKQIYHFTR